MIELQRVKRTDQAMLELMSRHYSKPQGFVGRNICYLILVDFNIYGAIVGGSATQALPGRNEFFHIDVDELNQLINNIFFRVERINGRYPYRNFTNLILEEWRFKIAEDWEEDYGDKVLGFETLVEVPRTGEVYRRDDWTLVGQTKGFTCKRVSGKTKHEKYTGVRVWDYENLKPKDVWCRYV